MASMSRVNRDTDTVSNLFNHMFKKLSFKRKLLVYLFPVFIVFICTTLLFQYNREKEFRKKELDITLSDITELTHNYIIQKGLFQSSNYSGIDSLIQIFPKKQIRITLIALDGKVLYDNYIQQTNTLENHKSRPEIVEAGLSGFGTDVRKSVSTHQPYYYYARKYKDFYIRTAVEYNVEVINFLKAERFFIVFNILLALMVWLALWLVIHRVGQTISKLKDFSVSLKNGEKIESEISFPEDEIGVISKQIVVIYDDLKSAEQNLMAEKERLFMHLFSINDGVAFFTAEKRKVLANNQFIKLLNHVSDKPVISAEQIFTLPDFEFIQNFLENESGKSTSFSKEMVPQFEYLVQKNGRYINTRCIVLNDRSFELVLTDHTSLEKRKRLKQQITSNISHELKTPVTSIKGYLETLQGNNLEQNKRHYFVNKAIAQVERLNDLIGDLAHLNKIEEARDLYAFDAVNVNNIINEVVENLLPSISERHIVVDNQISTNVVINGSATLLFSVFLNLIENAVKYAGEQILITIKQYYEDDKSYYFSFTDNGPGIPEEHYLRIFERFYRIDDGRSRKSGGTGLGLAIVKNAIQLHSGDISVKNRPEGGLEFLFTLGK